MAWFRNHYRCARCGKTWISEWSATCEDDCPHCGAWHMSPHKSEDADPPEDGAKARKIAELNDAFRTTFQGGTVVMTASVDKLPDRSKAQALARVATHTDFSEDNDPHGEHDFGSFELCGRKFFWKIDYYDKEMQHHSPDPSNPDVTTRVLTVMLAEDY